jgi:hypothetical protein
MNTGKGAKPGIGSTPRIFKRRKIKGLKFDILITFNNKIKTV